MNLTTSQKNELQMLFYNYENDSFFSFLNSSDRDKKNTKLSNAKEAYASLSYDEDALFLIDDTVFGSSDEGMVITNKAVYIKKSFEDKKIFLLEDISECRVIEDEKISINYDEINMVYLQHSEQSVVNIINQLREFYKLHIIKEKYLDVESTISIPYTLAQSGGKFKDIKSGYDITIPKGVKNYTTWSWDGYGKSYKNIKGKLTVKVIVEQPIKPKPQPKPIPKPIQKSNPKPVDKKVKEIYVDCINCGKRHLNPKKDECNFCANSLTKKAKKIQKPKPQESLNDIKIDDVDEELIITCINCEKDIQNYTTEICPYCKENIFIKKVVQEPKDSITINKDKSVKTIQDDFKLLTSLTLRIYNKNKIAEESLSLENMQIKEGEIKVSTRMKIKTIEDNFKEFNLKVQIASSDNEKLCDNKLSLAKAKDKYK